MSALDRLIENASCASDGGYPFYAPQEIAAARAELAALRQERDALLSAVKRKHDDGYAWMEVAREREKERDALRALLQKCEGYVGIAMRASPDTGDIVRLLSRIDAALRGKEGT